jgi:mannose-6-phosphate isomerase
VLERIDLAAHSIWALDADRETWVLVIEGQARIGSTNTTVGDAIFAEADRADIEAGPGGMSALVAYPGPQPVIDLLQDSGQRTIKSGTPAAGSPKSNEIVEAQT